MNGRTVIAGEPAGFPDHFNFAFFGGVFDAREWDGIFPPTLILNEEPYSKLSGACPIGCGSHKPAGLPPSTAKRQYRASQRGASEHGSAVPERPNVRWRP